ncbi:hypothetical protein [Streptomyces bauhiniae]|uniref:hypothetical protein n=1 Tax=Streptomyces bauhiniae TaxID=2340725 RepID=UPI00345316C9
MAALPTGRQLTVRAQHTRAQLLPALFERRGRTHRVHAQQPGASASALDRSGDSGPL